jgi:hypothetical protein
MTPLPVRRRAPRAAALLVLATGLASGLTACDGDFDPFNRVTELRVLAVQSEPPAPAPDETTVLTPLVYTPPGETVTSYAWSWCPFADGTGTCLLSEAELRAAAGEAGAAIPPYDLGTGPTASFPHTIPVSLLDALCDGTPTQPAVVDCEGGFPVTVKVTIASATTTVVTVRTLYLRRPGDPDNTNPVIDGLSVIDGSGEHPIDDTPTVTLPRLVETELRAQVRPEMAESYPGFDLDDRPITARERLIFTWFVESGDTDAERTGFIDGIEPLEDAVGNLWEPADVADYPRDTARLLLVLRDDREGVTWRSATVTLGGAP